MASDHSVPGYLRDYADQYAVDPRAAAARWFREAKYGLFLHYGLYSLLGRHEWVQLREKIYVADYAKLADDFTADGFDARAICDLAADAGMKYVNLTTRHHDSFCLFRTKQTDFNSVQACGRDLVGELAEACRDTGLGLCLYYSHGRDWRHPHAPNNVAWGGQARPEFDPPEPTYAYGDDHHLDRYLAFMTEQITELLTQYGPVAAIWLDGIAVPLHDKSRESFPTPIQQPDNAPQWKTQQLYDHIHSLQPQVLVSYKQGLLGTEDFFAPEHNAYPESGGKPLEVCTTMCPGSWGYMKEKAGRHKDAHAVWEELGRSNTGGYNLLLNTGPLPDGSLDPEDTTVLREIGQRLRKEGWPGTTTT